MLLPWSHFTGIKETHMPQPFLKETFIRMWQEEKEVFEETCRSRFRLPTDLPQWVMRHEQLATGNFVPTGIRDTKLLKLSDDPQEMQKICEAVVSGHYSMVCINDNNNLTNTEQAQKCLSESFEKLLPEKSSYEK